MKNKKLESPNSQCCSDPSCSTPNPDDLNRRDFVKMAALGAGAMALPPNPVFAGPFSFKENDHLIPPDKKLSAEWTKSLYERGTPEVFSEEQLKYIGMPVGGIGCGQLYLGGDGRLWHWHIFKTAYSREKDHGQKLEAMTLGGHYAYPDKVFQRETRPVQQGTAIRITTGAKTQTRELNSEGFQDIKFRGEYPVGKVSYRDDQLPVEVKLEAFSPFVPGQLAKSALPVTVLNYRVRNTSMEVLSVQLASWLENAVCPYVNSSKVGIRRNLLVEGIDRVTIFGTAEALKVDPNREFKEDIVFEDFETGSYKRWKSHGIAFGDAPVRNGMEGLPESGADGDYYISSYNVRALDGKSNQSTYPFGRITLADGYTGDLTSKTFAITHDYITFLIAGGYHPGETALNLVVDGQVIRTQTGQHRGAMQEHFFDVRDYIGKKAHLQVVDNHQGIWGSIAVDHIVFTDKDPSHLRLEEREGYGSMALSLYQPTSKSRMVLKLDPGSSPEQILNAMQSLEGGANQTQTMDRKLVGGLGEEFDLEPGEEKEVTFVLSWFFPFVNEQEGQTGQLLQLEGIEYLNRHYFNWFKSANQVADYVCRDFQVLVGATRLWNKTYYDSTLPYWLLDRSFIPIDCMASNTFLWFDNGRIWAWEGVECCPGTCQHVWQYAQGMARIFPEAERTLRELTDFGYSFREDGGFGHRDETAGKGGLLVAHDGHCGTIMRAYREHKTSPDYSFLKRNYPKIKLAVKYIMNEDKDKDGILEGGQRNTLDAMWYGPMGWISSLYLGALVVGKEMALEVGDETFANECDSLIQKGRKNIVDSLFNGEYFIHKPDPNYPDAINTNDGCHIDQVLGQSFGWQVGSLERVIPKNECKSALESIWKYNFAPDAFLYKEQHKIIKGARTFATQGEAGTIMCTWPKGGDDKAVPGMEERPEKSERWSGPGGYFDEVMNGFEYQVATHMVWEEMLEKGLATARVVHDRYNPFRRNPYNEIECSDHYSRSMASYGVLLAVCGFDYHGPKGQISFAPRIDPEDFKAPFTTAEGWGSYSQQIKDSKLTADLQLEFGTLELARIGFQAKDQGVRNSKLLINGKSMNHSLQDGGKPLVRFETISLKAGDQVHLEVDLV